MLVFIPNTAGTDAIYRDHENSGASDDDDDDNDKDVDVDDGDDKPNDEDEDDDDDDTDEFLNKDRSKLRVSDSQYFAYSSGAG